jgi:hypothetical protein
MRKHIVGPISIPGDSPDAQEWFNLQEMAEIEVTSEEEGHPVESAFNFGAGPGWRAASPGKQRIRLVFDSPQSIHRIRLRFNERKIARSQEFAVRWSAARDEPLKEVIRQQWNFSPEGSTVESEDYAVDLKEVLILELTIDPDRGASEARATLAEWRLG